MVKRSTNNMHALDIRQLHRAGLLQTGRSSVWQWTRGGNTVASVNLCASTDGVALSYRTRVSGDAWQDVDYSVTLTWTPCNYGGERPWWQCSRCGRRVAVLYGGRYYACRHCHKLVYGTQREKVPDRAGSRADKIRKRLGWVPGILNANGCKPKGMHWKTFCRLRCELDQCVNQSLTGMSASLGLVIERLRRIKI